MVNHISKFSVKDKINSSSKFKSNVDEILGNYATEQKNLKMDFDYGFMNTQYLNGMKNNMGTRKEMKDFEGSEEYVIKYKSVLRGHKDKIVSLCELYSGEIASGSYDKTIKIWSLKREICVKTIKEQGYVLCLFEFEKDKLLAGNSQNCINLWDLDADLEGNDVPLMKFEGHSMWVNCIVKCNSTFFASGSNDALIKIWDYYNKSLLLTLKGHTDCILTLASISDRRICSGSADCTVRLWDWENGNFLAILKGHNRWIKFVLELSNGDIISGSEDKTIKVWRDEICVNTLLGHSNAVRTLCQINDNYFASGSFDNTIKIWDMNNYRCVQTLNEHKASIISIIKLSRNLVVSCSNDKRIIIWSENN